MSYDVWLVAGDARYPIAYTDHNYTTNVSRILDDAGADLVEMRDKRAGDLISPLRAAAAEIRANLDKYRPMEPDNGWGDCEGAATFIESIASDCEEYPEAVLAVSGVI